MKVHLRQIPSEGLRFEGEEPKDILELPAEDGIRQAGPVHYALDVGTSADGLWATGEMSVDVELHCVRCLEAFVYPAHVSEVALQVELPPGETVDLTPHLREDILLALPDYPHCDWSGERVCPGRRETEAPTADEPARPPSAWETLDQIKISSN
jgi:uncharacterized protein